MAIQLKLTYKNRAERRAEEQAALWNPIHRVDNYTGPSFPSFIRDAARFDLVDYTNIRHDNMAAHEQIAGTMVTNAEKLQNKMLTFSEQLGVLFLRNELGSYKSEEMRGMAQIMEVAREEPPMSREEAILIGNLLVVQWKAIEIADNIPEYCETLFPLVPAAQ